MGFFDRFRFAGRAPVSNKASIADNAEQEAIRLIDEGNAIEEEGRIDEAMQRYLAALRLAPNLARAHMNRGNILLQQGDPQGALAAFDSAIQHNPDYAAPHYNKGKLLHLLGQVDLALASYSRALEIQPGFAEAHNDKGAALNDLGQTASAVDYFRQALAIRPEFAEACVNLGLTLQTLGQLDGALLNFRRVLELKPDDAEVYNNMGNALQNLGQLDDALTSYRRALEIKPDLAGVYNNLGSALQKLGQLDDALTSYRRALEIKPDFAEAHSSLGNALQDLGQLDDALTSYRRALEIKPDYAEAHSNLLFFLSHSQTGDAPALFTEHCRFAEQFEAPLRRHWPQHTHSRDPGRRLQVGFVSGDLYHHAVATFIEPVLAHLAGYPQLSLHAYYNHTVEDSVTLRLRGYLKHWHPIAHLSDEALAQKIIEDKIDILIDLSGHSGRNRLLTFAHKPAPIQASWMGYPGTTGLQAMDYYFTDRYHLPPGQFEHQFTEKLAYLPAGAPFLPNEASPPVNALPALNQGYITLGSFNRLNKLSPSLIALWSTLMRALPTARLLLGGMPQGDGFNPLLDWFAQEGIAHERLSFYPRSDMPHYLALHHQVDICLDTFPYNGGTTTLHALWMGVPTLTLTGGTVAGRSGACILSHAGLESFIADDATDFVAKGLALASNLSTLANVRAGLRARLEQSPLRHPDRIAGGLNRALRIMWQRWCAGLPTASFEADLKSLESISQNPLLSDRTQR